MEYYSVLRAIRRGRADVVLMMVDAAEGVTEQDKKELPALRAGQAERSLLWLTWMVEKDGRPWILPDHIREQLAF